MDNFAKRDVVFLTLTRHNGVMNNTPITRTSILRFFLANFLSRLSFRVCPEDFIVRFCEETDLRIDWEEPHNRGIEEMYETWTADGTQRIPSDGRWKQGW